MGDRIWHEVGDGAFGPPFGTIRVCRVCDCLVAGGPTACVRCVNDEMARPSVDRPHEHEPEPPRTLWGRVRDAWSGLVAGWRGEVGDA